jgi:DNA-binding GntR family transcriptional regulator
MTFQVQFKSRNMPDQLAEYFVIQLANGDFKPGQRIFEQDLALALGVSRVPVREALRILQAQGVVRTEPNKGTYFAEFGSDDMAEMLEVRIGIERIALRRILKRGAAAASVIPHLNAAIDDMRRAAKLEDKLAYSRADLAFHSKIVEQSESLFIRPIWDSLSRGVLVFLMQQRAMAFDYQASIRDHELLVELIRDRKKAPLDQEIERHILNSLHRLRESQKHTESTALKAIAV